MAWEHRVVEISASYAGKRTIWRAEGGASHESMNELLAGYGTQGWELVNVMADTWVQEFPSSDGKGTGDVTRYRAFFKRPKP
jgi:hypothetical protein